MELAQDHTQQKEEDWDLNSGLSGSKAFFPPPPPAAWEFRRIPVWER
jgi:hypothetical protein